MKVNVRASRKSWWQKAMLCMCAAEHSRTLRLGLPEVVSYRPCLKLLPVAVAPACHCYTMTYVPAVCVVVSPPCSNGCGSLR
jgi:hypothetical protein